MTPATVSGPSNAPTWSIASCTANPRPRPVAAVACESSVSLAGERTALPTRSATTRVQATHRSPVRPSTGTLTAVRAYPAIAQAQKRRLRSASGPETSRMSERGGLPRPRDHADHGGRGSQVGEQRAGD
ncbi:hypothetical protein ADL25_20400 [Streptomyces sp. NRRL F-5122]|nr:hypothetical protein ADL25_20400 [Streptomyces sp. NRRL F-5122]